MMVPCTSDLAPAQAMVQSPSDRKSYRYLVLDNGIGVLLIHDPAVAEVLAAQAPQART
jgi:secreted Zn-dependent insulinase-like peptidase